MNKKGDLPVTLLVIGVFAVCTLALLSFFYSSYTLNKSFTGVEILEEANIKIQLGDGDSFSLLETATKISPKLGFDWIEDKIIFFVKYDPKN